MPALVARALSTILISQGSQGLSYQLPPGVGITAMPAERDEMVDRLVINRWIVHVILVFLQWPQSRRSLSVHANMAILHFEQLPW